MSDGSKVTPKVDPSTVPGHHTWLERPTTIRGLWIGFGVLLVLVLALDLGVEHHAHFGIEGTPGFSALYGFLACVLMVLGSKALGLLLKRKDTFYDD